VRVGKRSCGVKRSDRTRLGSGREAPTETENESWFAELSYAAPLAMSVTPHSEIAVSLKGRLLSCSPHCHFSSLFHGGANNATRLLMHQKARETPRFVREQVAP